MTRRANSSRAAVGRRAVAGVTKEVSVPPADPCDRLVTAGLSGSGPAFVYVIIEALLRADLVIVDELGFAPLDDTGAQLLFRFVAAAYERRALGIASHWPFEAWGRFLPEHTTAVSLLDRLLHHANVVVTDGESYRMRQARTRPRGGTKTH